MIEFLEENTLSMHINKYQLNQNSFISYKNGQVKPFPIFVFTGSICTSCQACED